MFEVDDFLMIGSLLLGAAYVVAAFRGRGGEGKRYEKGLRFFAVGVFTMLILPEVATVVLQAQRHVAVGLLLSVILWIVGALFWLASLRLLCLALREDSSGE